MTLVIFILIIILMAVGLYLRLVLKRRRLRNLEEQVGQLVAQGKVCPIPEISNSSILELSEPALDDYIARRKAWLNDQTT